jgi:hypothetical protein
VVDDCDVASFQAALRFLYSDEFAHIEDMMRTNDGARGSLSTTTRSSGFVGGETYVLFGPDGPLPALTVDITRRTPIATGVTGSVALEGRVYGSVNVARNEAPPDNLVPAYLNVEFNGIYTIPTAGPALNCDPDR